MRNRQQIQEPVEISARGLLVCFGVMIIGAIAIGVAQPALIVSYALTAALAALCLFTLIRFSGGKLRRER